MTTTGYSDAFGRTVANGLGSATSGQAYTLFGVATQFSVAPGTASIAISSAGEKLGYVDLQSGSADITGQVALSAIPATNLATAGFVAKLATVSNYYSGTMMVAASGAVSLRFSKVIGGGLTTISTTLVTGLTYVAGTFYNLRYSIAWSRPLQTNVMSLKLWAVGTAEPGGWMATATDAAITDYTTGTQFGLYGRDESTVVGSVITRYRAVVTRSYALPVPSTTDPMCYDPAFAYPKQTALESLADATDAAVASLDPSVSLAESFPRVRVSKSGVILPATVAATMTYTTTEFNVGTGTNLAYDNTGLYLPVGIWLATFELQLVQSPSDYIQLTMFGSTSNTIDMRTNPVHSGDQGVGGTGHVSATIVSSDPTTPKRVGVQFFPNNTAFTYTVTYMALSAIKVSDYFT